jgi:hypothetical protein
MALFNNEQNNTRALYGGKQAFVDACCDVVICCDDNTIPRACGHNLYFLRNNVSTEITSNQIPFVGNVSSNDEDLPLFFTLQAQLSTIVLDSITTVNSDSAPVLFNPVTTPINVIAGQNLTYLEIETDPLGTWTPGETYNIQITIETTCNRVTETSVINLQIKA